MGCNMSHLMLQSHPFQLCDDEDVCVSNPCVKRGPQHKRNNDSDHLVNVNSIHPYNAPYLGSYFFSNPSIEEITSTKSNTMSVESDMLTLSSVSSDEDDPSEGVTSFEEEPVIKDFSNIKGLLTNKINKKKRDLIMASASNTLPSFREGCPVRLKITESYNTYARDDSSFNSNEDNFSYDPYFSGGGKYVIKTDSGEPYGGNLKLKMGAQFSCLRDKLGRVLATTRAIQLTQSQAKPENIPTNTFSSHVIYAPKPFFAGQRPSKNRSIGPPSERTETFGLRLYPWALITKEGPYVQDAVSIHMVDPDLSRKQEHEENRDIGDRGSFFHEKPTLKLRNDFKNGIHTRTTVSRVQNIINKADVKKSMTEEIPCCHVTRDRYVFDIFDVVIAPGIDPLMIICCLAVHTKMDVEIMVDQTKKRNKP